MKCQIASPEILAGIYLLSFAAAPSEKVQMRYKTCIGTKKPNQINGYHLPYYCENPKGRLRKFLSTRSNDIIRTDLHCLFNLPNLFLFEDHIIQLSQSAHFTPF